MKKKILTVFFLVWHVPEIHSSDGVYLKEKCDSNCTWALKKVTSETIQYFPSSCGTVCGDLSINMFCDLTEDNLTMVFKEMRHLIGSFEVNRTKFKNLSFFGGLESIESGGKPIVFRSNYDMEEIGLSNLTTIITPSIQIIATHALKRLNFTNLKNVTSGNENKTLVPVGFSFLPSNFCITFQELEMFLNLENVKLPESFKTKFCEPTPEDRVCTTPKEGCVRLFRNLTIGPGFDTESMKSIEAIYGTLTIKETDFENLDFLKNLKYVVSLNMNGKFEDCGTKPTIFISENKDLVDYSLPKLKRVVGFFEDRSCAYFNSLIKIYDNNEELLFHPEMCDVLQSSLNGNDSVKVETETCDTLRFHLTARESDRTNEWNKKRDSWLIKILIGSVLFLFIVVPVACGFLKSKKVDNVYMTQ